MLKVSECSAPNSTVNNHKGSERGFHFPYGQLYFFNNQLVVAVWISVNNDPKTLFFSSIENFIANDTPEYRAEGDNVVNNARSVYVLGQVGDLLNTGKRITSGT